MKRVKIKRKKKIVFHTIFIIFVSIFCLAIQKSVKRSYWNLPIKTENRQSDLQLKLTGIGNFGVLRKARPNIPAHFHTGIDIKRPNPNYINEPVYAAAPGIVISMRDDGPYAQIIVEHSINGQLLWTVYEHVAGIKISLNQPVDENTIIARFMNRDELDSFGWHFDHFHFEIMKAEPIPVKPNNRLPMWKFGTHCLTCYSEDELHQKYFNPVEFLNRQWEE